jgi:hypothetical protein
MDFFNSLTLDLKVLVVAMAGFALLALFSGNHKAEKRYMIVFAVLAAASVYRFTQLPGDEQAQRSVSKSSAPHSVPAAQKRKPLESTHAR